MRIMIFGATGMLGHKLVQEFSKTDEVYAAARMSKFGKLEETGIIDPARLVSFSMHYDVMEALSCSPDVVINCIGVVKQVKEASDPLACVTVNSLFPHKLNQACGLRGARLIHVSTDCVFDGDEGPYNEESPPRPTDLYGRSKLLGEVSDAPGVTLRTSIIGREISATTGLIEWFLSRRRKNVKGFANALYTGFTTIEFARVIRAALDVPLEPGVYHASSDAISKFDLLRMVRDEFGLSITLQKDEEFHCDRRLDSCRFRMLTTYQPPTWEEMIAEMAADPTPYEKWRKSC